MKGKTVVFWKIHGVDRTKTEWEEVSSYSADGEHKTKMLVKKRFERNLYACDYELSKEDRVLLEIAMQYQENIGSPILFFCIRDLFREGDGAQIQNVTQWKYVDSSDTFEDETGQILDINQYMQAVHGLSPQIRTKGGVYIPADLDETNARNLGFAEVTPIRQEDFILSPANYAILNRFVEDCWKFSASPFIRENPAYQVVSVSGKYKLEPFIADSQIKGSLMDFRKLYLMDEPANFLKVARLLANKCIITHPIYKYMSDYKKEFCNKKMKKITENYFLKHILNIQGEYIPTYAEIVDTMFNTEYFHQGNDEKTFERQKRIFEVLPDKDMRLIVFYTVIQDLSITIRNACSYIAQILSELDKLTAMRPKVELCEKEKKFRLALVKKTYQLAEAIWLTRKIPETLPSHFLFEAKNKLIKKFGFPVDFFL